MKYLQQYCTTESTDTDSHESQLSRYTTPFNEDLMMVHLVDNTCATKKNLQITTYYDLRHHKMQLIFHYKHENLHKLVHKE